MSDEIVNTDDTGALNEAQQGTKVIIKHVPVAGKASSEDEPEQITGQNDNMIPKARFDQVNQQKKDAVEALKAVADSLAEDVPEAYKNLIPELSPADKIAWLRTASKMGIFNTGFSNGIDTKRPGSKAPIDYSKMTSEQMIARGYK